MKLDYMTLAGISMVCPPAIGFILILNEQSNLYIEDHLALISCHLSSNLVFLCNSLKSLHSLNSQNVTLVYFFSFSIDLHQW